MFQKNYTLFIFIFALTFFIREPIFIIFGTNRPEEICNETYIVFPTTPNSVLLLYLVTRAASLTNVHSLP